MDDLSVSKMKEKVKRLEEFSASSYPGKVNNFNYSLKRRALNFDLNCRLKRAFSFFSEE